MNLPHLEALAEEPVVTCTYNTSKYNVAIFNGKELSFMATFFFGFGLINWTIGSLQLDLYSWMIFREFFIKFRWCYAKKSACGQHSSDN